ncbi:Protein of unknown function [Cnuella takakiae]|uniref:DUF2911 domain-containing protein n=1 Tax=Cnuella takakiae TaxID=1302690 RepID=A0A1M4SKG8_9BACT|nr:DUF2911 domain-containing protein [Cnuella takakiae]OLY94531.1 hypothetical protein BUE76_23650 [Cnuella takakiae]SHE32696.1 Protein of unknown function [Cnuella takakiae]
MEVKKIIRGLLFSTLLLSFSSLYAQKESEVCYNPNLIKDTTKKSIKSVAVGKIGDAQFTINYHSPGVRKRVIWGGLVPFEEVWVTGAHNATTLEFNKDILVNGQKVPAGKYALFTIPGENQWVFIINKHWEQHLASEYNSKDDIVRVQVKPEKTNHLERLQYFIEPSAKSKGSLSVAWEKVKATVPITVQ